MEYFCQMEWSREQIKIMIEMYKKKSVLWDTECTDRGKKNDAWDEIAHKFQTNRAEVQYKMRKLIGQFHRERKKMEREGVKIRWFAFDSMRFLLDKDHQRPASSSTVEDNTQEEYESQRLEDEELTDETENDICSTADYLPNVPQSSLPPRRKYNPSTNEHLYQEPVVKKFKTDLREKDEFDMFGEYIASHTWLRKFRDSRDRALAKHRINQVIFDLEMCEAKREPASSTFHYEDSYSIN